MNEVVTNKERKKKRNISTSYVRKWRKHNPEKARQYNRDNLRRFRQQLKYEVIHHYSPEGKCQRCGFNDFRALSIDHVNGGGFQHYKTLRARGSEFYHWLRKHNYPLGFQVLCMNCQWIKRSEKGEVRKPAVR